MTQCPLSCALFPPVPLEIDALPQVWSKASMPFYSRAYFRLFFWRVWGDKVSCGFWIWSLFWRNLPEESRPWQTISLRFAAWDGTPLQGFGDSEPLNSEQALWWIQAFHLILLTQSWILLYEASLCFEVVFMFWCIQHREDLGFVSFVCEPLMFWFCSWSSYGFAETKTWLSSQGVFFFVSLAGCCFVVFLSFFI